MIDTHCHLTFPDFQGKIGATLDACAQNHVTGVITISTTSQDCTKALELAKSDERIWCSAGVHPCYADQEPHNWNEVIRVGQHERCVAWGELGLDRHYDEPSQEIQIRVLHDQLEMIRDQATKGQDLPIIVHCRKAFDALIPIFKSSGINPGKFVFHCFTGTPDDARHVLDFGAMISFTGVVTYKNAAEVAEAAKLVPLDRIMVETDSPYLAPVPHRGERPCQPAWAWHTAEFLAHLRGEPMDGDDGFHAAINRNTHRFFNIDAQSQLQGTNA